MGFWASNETGGIASKGSPCIWGDSFADILDAAMIEIEATFEVQIGRKPTPEELRRGLMFAAGGYAQQAKEQKSNEVLKELGAFDPDSIEDGEE